jgi:hypothetical protein
MMLRNLLNEMMRRRLLPVAAIAVLVAVVAPLLFLKGAPDGAPSADSGAPAAATEAKLPARAARLLASTDAGASGGGARGASHDPFGPATPATTPAAAGGGGAAKVSTATGSVTSSTPSAVPAVTHNPTPSTPSANPSTSPKSTTSSTPRSFSVDIRYGAKRDSKIRRAIPRYKAFYIHGKIVAVFVKYSPSRKAAVFAVAPGMHISGPVKCRVEDGVCKYLDIPAGSYARIAMVTPSKLVVSRRLDVVHAKRGASGATKATSASTRSQAACLMGKVLAMKPGDALIDRDACER